VQDRKTGLLVPPQDSYALAEALLRLLRNPDFAAGMGMKGRECVAAHFSFQRMVENTDQLYTELLLSRGVE
jgi:glycosyltransferase involved in cell wall biosynthesis